MHKVFSCIAMFVTAALLDTARKVLPLIVTISGRVGSDAPIICEQSGLRGVIVEETVSVNS